MTERKSKVVLIPCDRYEEELLYQKLKQAMRAFGGMEALVSPEEKTLLKPNMVRKADLGRPVVTHPAVVAAVGHLLKDAGVKDVKAGDSCGFGTSIGAAKEVGMDKALAAYGIPMIEFSDAGKSAFPEGIQVKSFWMSKEVVEADALINICKMKTHALERITGAVKNMYGCIYGMHKAKGHTIYPNAETFARMLIDINRFVKPRLYVMDGIVAMEGNGPTSGDPVPMNLLMIAQDPVAMDGVFCRLIDLDPSMVPTNDQGMKMGLGSYLEEDLSLLLLSGDGSLSEITCQEAVSRFGNPSFVVDRKKVRKNKWTKMTGAFQIFKKRPHIDASKCRTCGICVESCPVDGKAVNFRNGRKNPPVYDYKKCIRCFCCQEMCPHKAISVRH